MRHSVAGVLAALFVLAQAHAQEKPADKPKWDVNAPQGATLKQVAIDTDEGTWIDVDVSPDGRTIAFTCSATSTPCRSPAARRPDRRGSGVGGPSALLARWPPHRLHLRPRRWRQYLDHERRRQRQEAADQGGFPPPEPAELVARRPVYRRQEAFHHRPFAGDRGEGTGRAGLCRRRQVSVLHAQHHARPDLRICAGFEHQPVQHRALRPRKWRDDDGGVGLGGSVRPTPSPDGKKIAFVRREATRSKLYVRDLASGEERKIYDTLDQDVQETWAVTGVYPNMDWTPDSKSIVFWAGGKIRRVDADGANAAVIPFRVADSRTVATASHPADRSRTRQLLHQDDALRIGFARWRQRRVRKHGQALDPAGVGRCSQAAHQPRRGGRRRAVSQLVARRPLDRLRRMERRQARSHPHRCRWRRRGEGRDDSTRSLCAPALLA
ncbi:hypothetical protein DdX_19884 [Ditylenchus destructor]|uniref:Uncharacterized protein n=1 Tax=Ditylenchus destructor TaxID=166010 RepID=A0AAD4MIZ9_9BILA|nr:hypothetical protein DdX_19884 [Ditylenchus destructor]